MFLESINWSLDVKNLGGVFSSTLSCQISGEQTLWMKTMQQGAHFKNFNENVLADLHVNLNT